MQLPYASETYSHHCHMFPANSISKGALGKLNLSFDKLRQEFLLLLFSGLNSQHVSEFPPLHLQNAAKMTLVTQTFLEGQGRL